MGGGGGENVWIFTFLLSSNSPTPRYFNIQIDKCIEMGKMSENFAENTIHNAVSGSALKKKP